MFFIKLSFMCNRYEFHYFKYKPGFNFSKFTSVYFLNFVFSNTSFTFITLIMADNTGDKIPQKVFDEIVRGMKESSKEANDNSANSEPNESPASEGTKEVKVSFYFENSNSISNILIVHS